MSEPTSTTPTDRKALKVDAAVAKARSKAARAWYQKKRFVLPLGLLFVIVVLAVMGGDEEEPAEPAAAGDDTADAETMADDAPDDEAPAESEVDDLAIGDSIAMGDLEHVLHGARFAEGDETVQPEDGERWLVLDVEVTNLGDGSESVSSLLMWTLLDEDNRSQDLSLGAMMDADGTLDGELGPDRSLRGELGFAVSSDGPWELIFEPEIFRFGQAIYTVDPDEVR